MKIKTHPLTPEDFVQHSAYAAETMRRWRLEPEWFETDQPIVDRQLPIDQNIRRQRQLGALRIVWCELHGAHDVEQTGIALSELAARCIELALSEAERITIERFGTIYDRRGQPARLGVMALGKLGGNELNFNSDLDLVFVHDAVGTSDGRRALSATEYFARVVVEMTRLLESSTEHGRAWIVDARLRPFGQSGTMVWSLPAMERYFVDEGRVWERYAWLKARPVAGNLNVGAQLLEILRPFVFRRYLDYGLFESLRELHRSIDRNSRREDLAEDIKRGAGGIRELEFLVQSLQLLRGGRESVLRVSGFLPALRAAETLHLIEPEKAGVLSRHYCYMRRLENYLQAVTGRQTHALPEDQRSRASLASLMGSDWTGLKAYIDQVRQQVSAHFHTRFEEPATAAPDPHGLWPPHALESKLQRFDFDNPTQAAQDIQQLTDRLARRGHSAEARKRLDRLMPVLLGEVLQHRPADTGLRDILALIETISRRSAYLALLYERPETLKRMVRVFRGSDRIARWVINNPHLLDDLLDPVNGFFLPALMPLKDDFEGGMNTLARFRQAGFVRTALGQLDDSPDRSASRVQLTELAETVLKAALKLTSPKRESTPALIGYGNLGASTLHYESDLDLVFLHQQAPTPLRSVQRLISAMQLPLVGGKLYEIDTRLRPNGNSGLLVSTLDGFAQYQREKAWLWEHQALIRARCIDATSSIHDAFEDIRKSALCQPRDRIETRKTLLEMRQKQRHSRRETTEKQLLTDIQFIAELGVLLHAAELPALIQYRATDAQLKQLAAIGWLPENDLLRLIEIQTEALEIRDAYYLKREFHGEPGRSNIEFCRRIWDMAFKSE